MDKNLISIDDLVRQRLGGKEEEERAGAWLEMRSLLDKEMPQAGGMYWRRALTVIAALLLVATISVGGYKLSTSRHSVADNDALLAAASDAKPADIAVHIAAISGAAADRQVAISAGENKELAAVNNKVPAAKASGIASVAKSSHKKATDKSTIAAPVAVSDIAAASKTSNTTTTTTTDATNTTGSKPVTLAGITPAKAGTAAAHKSLPVANNTEDRKAANDTQKQDAPADNANNSSNELTATTKSTTTATAENSIAKNTNTKSIANKANHKKAKTTTAGSDATAAAESSMPAIVPVAKTAATSKSTAASAKNDNSTTLAATTPKKRSNDPAKASKDKGMQQLALGSHAATAVVPAGAAVAGTPGTPGHKGTGNNKNVLNGHTAAVAGTGIVKADKIIAAKNTTKATSKANRTPKAKIAKAGVAGKIAVATGNNMGTVAPVKPVPAPATTKKPGTDNAAAKEMAAANMRKGKKVVEKMVLYEHYIKSAAHVNSYHLDTISIEMLTQDAIPAERENNNTNKAARKAMAPGTSMKNETESNSSEEIVPGAASSATTKQALASNGSKSKKGSGTSAVEKLSATFNDIKYNIKGVQFAPGLTAGINGTFFGPNSFKGFQFGVTGSLVFDEKWSIMGELKYFHRINNDYTIDDNYNAYTFTPSQGAYMKDSMLHSYSFSTLHSFELPVSVRYTKGKITYFAGGNFVYTMAVNTGAAPLLAPGQTTPVYVPAAGSDNAPKLKDSDFNTRLGIGYLLGFSYQVSPDVNIDFRSVQTVWDNANTSGSKIVSTQLYKSPSLQLSIGYRFGGKKKDNE